MLKWECSPRFAGVRPDLPAYGSAQQLSLCVYGGLHPSDRVGALLPDGLPPCFLLRHEIMRVWTVVAVVWGCMVRLLHAQRGQVPALLESEDTITSSSSPERIAAMEANDRMTQPQAAGDNDLFRDPIPSFRFRRSRNVL